jgi:hypothetical protein
MDTRLVYTSTKILRLFLDQYLKEMQQENLTSGFFLDHFNKEVMDKVSFGSNQIINEIGRDRSHISKAIEFLKRIDLLTEFGKWEKGKTKDTRITELGLEIAEIIEGIEQYNKLYSKFHEKLETHYRLPNKIDENAKQKYLISKGWDENIINTYDFALSNIRDIEFSLVSCFISILIEKYIAIMLKSRAKSDVKYMMEEIMLGFIRDQLRRANTMSEYLRNETKQYAINRLLSKIIIPNFMFYSSVIDYMKFDYEDLPHDGNKKFVKEDIKKLLKMLFSIMKPTPQMIPVGLDLEKYRDFLGGIDFAAVEEEWTKLGIGDDQILSFKQVDSTTESRQFVLREDGTYMDATTDFQELAVGKQGTDIKPWKLARCSYFRTKLVVAIHKDVRINAFSSEFQSNYEKGKEAIYYSLKDIDYVNEFGIDMPIFEIIRDENGFIKSINIENLAKDVQNIIISVILHVIVRTLMRTNSQFLEFLDKIRKTMQLQNKVKDKNEGNTGRHFENEDTNKVEGSSTNKTEKNYDNGIKYDFLRDNGL